MPASVPFKFGNAAGMSGRCGAAYVSCMHLESRESVLNT